MRFEHSDHNKAASSDPILIFSLIPQRLVSDIPRFRSTVERKCGTVQGTGSQVALRKGVAAKSDPPPVGSE